MNWWWVASCILMLGASATAGFGQGNWRMAGVSFAYAVANALLAGAK